MCPSPQSFDCPAISNCYASHVTNATRHTSKRVSFSEYSSLHLYGSDPSYRCQMSYSKSEIEDFRFRAASEARHLRQLLARCPLQDANRICHLLIVHNVLAPEDVLGIEHLLSENASRLVFTERLFQRASLLAKQEELREKNELDAELLAEVAISRSAKNAERARVRAAIAP
ncbi:hypothetical protein HJC23_013690 [Cyclotella cryptica]|uniref:Uncharacterized protein n=1 Tax=Cyclotella cryptica TaxID=29204 RepID=A0ABD3QXA0_9STRA|eukprot:CCRYP_001536-RA/>CCRYP_001536-RA protein AED:0.32 eAED:0.32 QI:0/-1/0/1/-1/1/1/0/171